MPPRRGSAAGRNFLASPYYSQRAVFACLWAFFHYYYYYYYYYCCWFLICSSLGWFWGVKTRLYSSWSQRRFHKMATPAPHLKVASTEVDFIYFNFILFIQFNSRHEAHEIKNKNKIQKTITQTTEYNFSTAEQLTATPSGILPTSSPQNSDSCESNLSSQSVNRNQAHTDTNLEQ